eukprot:gene5352-biopygen187
MRLLRSFVGFRTSFPVDFARSPNRHWSRTKERTPRIRARRTNGRSRQASDVSGCSITNAPPRRITRRASRAVARSTGRAAAWSRSFCAFVIRRRAFDHTVHGGPITTADVALVPLRERETRLRYHARLVGEPRHLPLALRAHDGAALLRALNGAAQPPPQRVPHGPAGAQVHQREGAEANGAGGDEEPVLPLRAARDAAGAALVAAPSGLKARQPALRRRLRLRRAPGPSAMARGEPVVAPPWHVAAAPPRGAGGRARRAAAAGAGGAAAPPAQRCAAHRRPARGKLRSRREEDDGLIRGKIDA